MPRRVIEVVVRGRLDRSVAVALDGFTVETADTGLTRITGPVPDQAKLIGLLAMFDDLHIEVVSVNPGEN